MRFARTSRWRFPLGARIAFFFSVAFSVCLFSAFTIAYFRVYYSLEGYSRSVIEAKWREMAAVLGDSDVRALKEFLGSQTNGLKNAHFMVRVITDKGETLFLKPSTQSETFEFEKMYERFTNPEDLVGWHALQAVDDEDKFDLLTDKVSSKLYLQVGKSSEDREEVVERLGVFFLITAASLTILGALVGSWYAHRSLRPVRDLINAIQTIERGDLSRRVHVSAAQDELRDLSLTFNRMIDRLDRVVRAMKESLDNVAHDLRTPLTRIKNTAEAGLLAGDPGKAMVALAECAEHTDEVAALLSQLLDISEANAGELELKIERVDVTLLVAQVADLYDLVAEEKRIGIQLEMNERPHWPLDARRMRQVIGNLLDNAIKYSPPDTKVRVALVVEKGSLVLTVIDQGPGISPEDLPRIWDRLFRGDRSRSTQGMGIGLALVKSIVEAHGGTVSASMAEDGGAVFRVELRA